MDCGSDKEYQKRVDDAAGLLVLACVSGSVAIGCFWGWGAAFAAITATLTVFGVAQARLARRRAEALRKQPPPPKATPDLRTMADFMDQPPPLDGVDRSHGDISLN
jgi:hypothetical protein